ALSPDRQRGRGKCDRGAHEAVQTRTQRVGTDAIHVAVAGVRPAGNPLRSMGAACRQGRQLGSAELPLLPPVPAARRPHRAGFFRRERAELPESGWLPAVLPDGGRRLAQRPGVDRARRGAQPEHRPALPHRAPAVCASAAGGPDRVRRARDRSRCGHRRVLNDGRRQLPRSVAGAADAGRAAPAAERSAGRRAPGGAGGGAVGLRRRAQVLQCGVRARSGIAYLLGGVLAVGVLAVPWLVLMQREFGNPVFPLFNGWFRSPHFLEYNMINERFALRDSLALLAFPYQMAALGPRIYAENFAPDLRFAALVVALLGVAMLAVRRGARVATALRGPGWRVLVFFAVATALWLATSANARYGLIVLLLAGVCLARLGELLLPARAARVILALLLLLQVAIGIVASPPRWFIAAEWSGRWLPYQVPERAVREPALYMTVEILPVAAVAPFLHPGSSMVNVRGQHSLPTDSPRLKELLERHRGHVRTIGRFLELAADGRPAEAQVKAYDARLLRF